MDDLTAAKSWVQHWQRVGPILEEIERAELRAFSFQQNWAAVDGLLQLGADTPNIKDREQSGLVEQQRLFAMARRQCIR